MFQSYSTHLKFPETRRIDDNFWSILDHLIGEQTGTTRNREDIIRYLDIFHPNFDKVFELVKGVEVIFYGHSSNTNPPPSGMYYDKSRFGDSLGEVGFAVPAGFKVLTVKGSNPAYIREMIKEIRTGKLQLTECWGE